MHMILISLGLGLIIGTLISIKNKLSQQHTTILSYDEVMVTPDAYVIYLRSFKDDGEGIATPIGLHTLGFALTTKNIGTYERGIIAPFRKQFNIIAVGKPNEKLPELGCARLYLKDEEWQEKVSSLIQKATYILVKPSNSDGLYWELQHIAEKGWIDKLILSTHIGTIDNRKVRKVRYTNFSEKFKTLTNITLPQYSRKHHYIMFTIEHVPQAITSNLKKYISNRINY